MDGVVFFRVTSAVLVEGVANLNATAAARRLEARAPAAEEVSSKQ
jgi:hypothetical protein